MCAHGTTTTAAMFAQFGVQWRMGADDAVQHGDDDDCIPFRRHSGIVSVWRGGR